MPISPAICTVMSVAVRVLTDGAGGLNEHVKRAAGVTAGHLISQRVLTEAKHRQVFTNQPSTRSPMI
jgi:hypothetical protein